MIKSNKKIREYKIRQIIKLFSYDITATNASKILKINRNTINRYYKILREIILKESIQTSREKGIYELDESYFGAKRVRGKRGRGAAEKHQCFAC
jgi:transposase